MLGMFIKILNRVLFFLYIYLRLQLVHLPEHKSDIETPSKPIALGPQNVLSIR